MGISFAPFHPFPQLFFSEHKLLGIRLSLSLISLLGGDKNTVVALS